MKLVDYNRLAAQVEFGEKALFHILSCVEGLVTHRMILHGFFEVNQKLVTMGVELKTCAYEPSNT